MGFGHIVLHATETVLDKTVHFQPKSYCPWSQFLRQPKNLFLNCGPEHNNPAARVRRLYNLNINIFKNILHEFIW